MNDKMILLTQIGDQGIQPRDEMKETAVQEYVDAMEAGSKFPPIHVFSHHGQFHLADGFHRVEAARRLGRKHIAAFIHQGGVDDAAWFACQSNVAHGIRRTNSDKRKSAALALLLRPSTSDSQIAVHCAVSQPFVSKIRRELAGSGYDELKTRVREASDGREVRLPDLPDEEERQPSPRRDGHPEPDPAPRPKRDPGEALKVAKIGATLQAIKRDVMKQIEADTPSFRELNGSVWSAPIDRLLSLLKDHCVPEAECPACGGKEGGCKTCYHRGWVSKRGLEVCKEDDG